MVIVFQCILALDSVKNIQYVLQEYTDYDHQWFMCISSYTCGVKEWNVPYFLSMMLWHACIWSCCMWIQAPVDCCVCVIARVYACLLNRWLWRRVWRWDMLKAFELLPLGARETNYSDWSIHKVFFNMLECVCSAVACFCTGCS